MIGGVIAAAILAFLVGINIHHPLVFLLKRYQNHYPLW